MKTLEVPLKLSEELPSDMSLWKGRQRCCSGYVYAVANAEKCVLRGLSNGFFPASSKWKTIRIEKISQKTVHELTCWAPYCSGETLDRLQVGEVNFFLLLLGSFRDEFFVEDMQSWQKIVKRGKTSCFLGGPKMKHHVTCCFGTTASSCNDWRRKGDRSLQYPLGVFCQTSFRLKGRLWGKCDISYKKTREFFQKMIETLTFVRSKRGSFRVRTSIGKQDFHFQWFDAPAHQDVKWWRNLRGKKWVWPGKPFGFFIPLPISSTKWVGKVRKIKWSSTS